MKNEQDMRTLLIENTIQLISDGGFERATTHAITHGGKVLPSMKMNEVYIYRLFGSKERLYDAAFDRLDTEMFHAVRTAFAACGEEGGYNRDAFYESFREIWRFLLSEESRCRCYIRYYYSIYLRDDVLERHKQRYTDLVTIMSPLFKPEADVKSIIHSVFTTLLDFAIRVYNGDLEDTELNAKHIFNVVYCMMVTYFKDEYSPSVVVPQFI
jgi:AcrR family transcriptional regulator